MARGVRKLSEAENGKVYCVEAHRSVDLLISPALDIIGSVIFCFLALRPREKIANIRTYPAN